MAALRRISTRKRRTKVDQVGFSTLPEQVHRKSLKKGFEFTLLVVGDSGLGKSTLINSLFMTDLYADRVIDDVANRVRKTVAITTQTCELEEKGVRLKLTVVDTPGFGDSLNSNEAWKPVEDYIDSQFYSFYLHESGYGAERKKIQDTRVHCCLYFIPPHVRGLRPIDIDTMKKLQSRVNIIPIIAKADSLTKKELETLKQNILNDIERFEVKIYEFPQCDSDDDESFKKLDEELRGIIPFAVIGSNTVIESGSKKVRGRIYPWGIIDIESDSCDFTKLRTFLCSSHMQDLKDLTHDLHYENYRTELIKSNKINGVKNPCLLRGKNITPDEADRLLQQKEQEIKNMQELLAKMKMNMVTLTNQNSFSNKPAAAIQVKQQQQQQGTVYRPNYQNSNQNNQNEINHHQHHQQHQASIVLNGNQSMTNINNASSNQSNNGRCLSSFGKSSRHQQQQQQQQNHQLPQIQLSSLSSSSSLSPSSNTSSSSSPTTTQSSKVYDNGQQQSSSSADQTNHHHHNHFHNHHHQQQQQQQQQQQKSNYQQNANHHHHVQTNSNLHNRILLNQMKFNELTTNSTSI